MPRNKLSPFERKIRFEISNNLKNILKEKSITQTKMSDDIDIPKSTISGYIAQKSTPNAGIVQKMADYLNVNKSDIDPRYEDDLSIYPNIIPITQDNTVQIPLLGTIACGDPITAEQNIDSYIPTLKSEIPSGNNFYLMCKGDSMYPTINDGAKVLIHEQPNVEDGEIAAVLIENESTLKRVKRIDGNKVLLMPDNSKFEPILLDGTKNAKILGKAIKVTFEL